MKPRKPLAWRKRAITTRLEEWAAKKLFNVGPPNPINQCSNQEVTHSLALAQKFQAFLHKKAFVIEQPGSDR